MPALTPSVLLANQYEAFPALPGPPHGRAGGQDRPMSGRARHDCARQAGLGQRQTGQVMAGQGRKVLGRTGRRHEASAVGQYRTGLSRGGSRKTPRGGSRIAVVPLPIPKIQKLNRFRPLDFGGALCSAYFIIIFQTWPVVPLLDRWCPWQARGASDWCPC